MTSIKPLQGIRVVEFTHAVAGPVAGHILGDMGAHVIKIEAPNARHANAPADAPPASGAPDRPYNRVSLWTELNRSKSSLVLDLTREDGRALALMLLAKSDALIENFSPRVMSNLRLDYETVAAANAGIVYVSMPAFGRSGPYADRRSYGPGIDAMSGLSHLTGYIDGPPLKPGNFYCDYNAGLLAAFGLLAAVWHRRRTGRGQYVEIAMIEGEVSLLGDALMDYFMNNRVRGRAGNRHPRMAPHGVYPAAGQDRWITIACRNDHDFQALSRAIGQPGLAADNRFSTLAARKTNEDALDEIIAVWSRQHDHVQAMEQLQAAGVPAGAALDVAELLNDPHVRARGVFQTVQHPEMGPHPHTRVAFQLHGTPVSLEKHAPLFGEDIDSVLQGELGLSSIEVSRLIEGGVVRREPL